MEPIVCTLLRLWMLPLLRRAYINLACSKAALWCSALPLRVALGVVAAVKRPGCIRPSPRLGLNLAASEGWRMQTQTAGAIHQHGASCQTGLRKSFASYRARSRQTFSKVGRKVEFRSDSYMQWGKVEGGENPYCRHPPQGEALQVGVTHCDKDKAQAFSQQGLRSLFVLLQIFVTPRKWPPLLCPASSVSSLLLQSSDNLLREHTPILSSYFIYFKFLTVGS